MSNEDNSGAIGGLGCLFEALAIAVLIIAVLLVHNYWK